MEPSQVLKGLILVTCEYYGKKISDGLLQMYFDDLEDLPIDEVIAAYKLYRRDPANKFSPLPAQIRDIVRPTVTKDGLARDCAARIVEAVNKFGWNNPASAMEHIGDLGKRVVEMNGGWTYVCQTLGTHTMPLTMFIAQARDLSKALIEKSAAGTLDQPVELPEGKNDKVTIKLKELIDSTRKRIE